MFLKLKYRAACMRMAMTNRGQIIVTRDEHAFNTVLGLFIKHLGFGLVGYTHSGDGTLAARRAHFSDGTIINYTVDYDSTWKVGDRQFGGLATVVSNPYIMAYKIANFLKDAGFAATVITDPDESVPEGAMAFVDTDAMPGTRLVLRRRKMGAFPSRERPW